MKALVAQNARVVDDDVDAAEVLDRRVDDRLTSFGGGDRIHVGDRAPAGRGDLVDHDLRGGPGTQTMHVDAKVVDDHRRAAGQFLGVGAAQAVPGSGDDGDLLVEADLAHGCPSGSVGLASGWVWRRW